MVNFPANELDFLFSNLYNKYGIDLSNYAQASFLRRLERFLSIHPEKNLFDLSDKLVANNTSFDAFIKEITVNTTEMFRDPTCWAFIRKEIIPALNDLPSVRIWHAGCSSGEEVHSMAILLKEEGLYDKCKIVASDLNKEIIEAAKSGTFSARDFELNQENYKISGGHGSLSDYFNKEDKSYIMDRGLLTNVRFLRHDLSTGTSFSKFDLIICRNVMIYFNKELQEKVFSLFEGSLFKKGFVVIGKKESMAYYNNAPRFAEINATEKIYRLK
ncbi:MAG: CheR family methyltransferase [Bacteroidia bacterium]